MAYISVPEVREIRNALKERFRNKLKFSVRRQTHQTVVVSILSGDIDFGSIGQDGIEYIKPDTSDYGKHTSLFDDIIRIIKDTNECQESGWNDTSKWIAYYFHLEVGKDTKLYKFNGVEKVQKLDKNRKRVIL